MSTTLPQIKRRFARLIRLMSKEEAHAYLLAHRIYCAGRRDGTIGIGGRLGDPGIRYLTGGYSSQSLDGLVLRKLGVKAGIVKNPR